MCSRDELRTRAPALPPSVSLVRNLYVVMPHDPESGGTWIAANDAGLVFALLNASMPHQAAPTPRSRGLIIPALVDCATVEDALARAVCIPLDDVRPFRLLVIDDRQLVECWPNNGRLRSRRLVLSGAAMRTSSGLGDTLVARPRRRLFRRLFGNASDPVATQDAFHDHQWRGQEAISVRMERADARTVSRTLVEVGGDSVALSYQATGSPPTLRARIRLVARR